MKGKAMARLTVTAKGQVTLRKDLLNHLGVHPGQKVAVDKLPGGAIEIRAERRMGKISDFFGSLKGKSRRRRPLTIDEMQEITETAWAGKR
ncbi:MAG TPA: AbrB/MazE/SpoVT family DNA-binding domain-containing protein [Micropepsaceae bacterium]|nr:AbrB/MazE/SpoVT family DNA-binding domain-containing protein [Micropepsaceae bacterium]